MSTFYLLPPRALLGQHLLGTLGIPQAQVPLCMELAEIIGRAVETSGAYVVFRDDLPPSDGIAQSLVDGFGAETEDEIIEIALDSAPRRWHVPAQALAA